jgi:hypothetical protein
MVMMTIMVATPLKADEAQCREVLHKCDEALNAQIDLNITKDHIIDDQAALIEVLNTKINQESIWKPIAIGGIAVIAVETLVLILRK